MARILVVDDEVSIAKALERFLTSLGHDVQIAHDGEEGWKWFEGQPFDVAFVDLVMPKLGGVELIRRMKDRRPALVAIVLTGFATITSAVDAMKAGAYHYITKPFELDDIATLLETALEHRNLKEENQQLKRELHGRYRFEKIIGSNAGLGPVFDMLEKVAETDSTVLILGESGTGKELIAHALHYNSPRRDHHLVTVNCAAIPEELLESELFGHMKGAFTGAVQTRNGRFDAANHGTIFLDEIGDMSLKLQVKLLRVLQERKFEPVGSNKTHDVNVRIIAATNQDLDRMVKEKRFREDLYYRLNVIPIRIPPLRERHDDIPLLVSHFIEKYRQSAKQPVHGMTDQALSCLLTYSWPGNVRELENVIERAAVFCHQDRIEISHLPDKIRCEAGTTVTLQHPLRATAKSQMLPEDGLSLKDAVADFEWNLISQALKRAGGNKHRAALLLKLNRTTLVEKLKKQRGMEGM